MCLLEEHEEEKEEEVQRRGRRKGRCVNLNRTEGSGQTGRREKRQREEISEENGKCVFMRVT